jgi:integrase
MASIGNDRRGLRRILFSAPDGKRKTIRLGKASMRQAEAFKVKVEQLVHAALLGHSPDDETSRWLTSLDKRLYGRITAVGLAPSRSSALLVAWIDGYLAERIDLKPRTKDTLRATRDHLSKFFGADRPMRSITRDEASRWRAKMLADGLALATVRLYVGNARTLFGTAAQRDLIPKNPFDHLAGGTTASKNERYVTADEADRILTACEDNHTKLLLALPRFAGLRFPSEAAPLTWADVDFHTCRLNVRSPKTEHHAGHEKRTVPITPKLAAILQAAFDDAPEGHSHVVERRSNEYCREKLAAAIKRAEVEPWEDMFRTLRSSCEREWAMTLPQYAVSKWMGHGIAVSGKHYANHVPDEVFQKAAQKAAQQASESASTEPQATNPIPALCGEIPAYAGGCEEGTRRGEIDPSNRRS